jgi:putative flippase GtrA
VRVGTPAAAAAERRARRIQKSPRFVKRHVTILALMHQLTQYLAVAVIAFAVDFGIYMTLVQAGLNPLAAAPAGFLGGLLCNYLLSTRFVFKHRRITRKSLEFFYFGVIGVLGLGFNEILIGLFYQLLHYSAGISKLIAAGLVFMFNFGARRAALFSPRNSHE